MKKLILVALTMIPVSAFAGSVGGSNPPGFHDMMEIIKCASGLDTGIFDAGDGHLGLATKRSLQPRMLLKKNPAPHSEALSLPAEDFATLRGIKTVAAIGKNGEAKVYEVEPTDADDALILTEMNPAP